MLSYQRSHVSVLSQRLAESPHHIIALFGPRQTGKTTIVRQALQHIEPGHRYWAVDEPDPGRFLVTPTATETTFPMSQERDKAWVIRCWEEARIEAERSPRGFVLAFDEIQKIPNWSETVKGLWDADRAKNCPLHVVILGSAPLLVQSGLSESLAGRFETIRVTHWSFREMSEAFDVDLPAYLYFGGYPGAARTIRDVERWRAYILGALVEANIDRDILSMTRVDKPALLKRLFELGTYHSGQILSYTRMLGHLQDAGNTTTLARYLDLLKNAGMLTGLPKYAAQPQRRRASSPKLNVFNTALMTAVSGYSFVEAQHDRSFWGRIVESAVGAHLLNTATSDMNLYYWRDGQFEVDFVLQRGALSIAIEVKSGKQRTAPRGLDDFERRFSPHRSLVVGEGGIPLNEFFTVPALYWFDGAES
ncbi:MAG: ATP-binding protein [Boseongicola sp.]|nr:ATP-binding protein [Boseongicola sp.]